MKNFFKNNGLSLVLFGLALLFLVGLALSGVGHENEYRQEHGQATISLGEYVTTGAFYEAVFENWESEFLQMGALVVLTIWLTQKGAADSRKLRGHEKVDAKPHQSIIRSHGWRAKGKAIGSVLYSNSLSLALFALFAVSFLLHAFSGLAMINEEASWHGGMQMSLGEYVTSSTFWFESFQNWQSEFLSVGVLIVLSIYLRQWRSPESKPVGASNDETGK